MQHDTSLSLFIFIRLIIPYIHGAPRDTESKEHLKKLDEYIDRIMKAEPGAMILITADHTVNHNLFALISKKLCLNQPAYKNGSIRRKR
jgi:hypothetical protein